MFRIIIFIIFSTSYLYSQEISGKITYEIFYNKETMYERIKEAKKNQDTYETALKLEKVIKQSTPTVAELIFSKTKSEYKAIKKLESDNKKDINPVFLRAGKNQVYYRNLEQQKNTFITDALGKEIAVNYKNIDFEITSETRVILGYTCYKAIRKDKPNLNYVAWFTTEIPFSFGPKEINGLPGLVLAYDDGIAFSFVAKKIRLYDKEIEVNDSPNIDEISFDEYQKRIRKNMPEF